MSTNSILSTGYFSNGIHILTTKNLNQRFQCICIITVFDYKLLKDRTDLRRYNKHIFFLILNCIIKFGIFQMKHYFFNIISLVNNGINRMNAISPTTKKKEYLNFFEKKKNK